MFEELFAEEELGWQRLREGTVREEESSRAEIEEGEESRIHEGLEEDAGEGEETCNVKVRRAPKGPSKAERDEHEALDLPYR